jgi:hypothetical protein
MDHMMVYKSFRFGFYLPEKDQFVGSSSIHTDPFTGDLWVVRAHIKNEPTLVQHFSETLIGQVFFFERGMDGDARRIGVKWTGHRWSPIDADATENLVAMERLVLTGVTYGPVDDIEAKDVPQPFKTTP